jgi:adenylate kinase family enzyme
VAREVPVGRRIVVYGPSGSGKTTLSRRLGEKLELPVLELDAVVHAHPNWVDLSREEFREKVTAYLESHPGGWVIEGNYSPVRDLILPKAETAIWIQLPWHTVYRRLAWRTISRTFQNAPLWNGNRETFRQTFFSRHSMLIWGIAAWRSHRRSLRETLVTNRPQARVYVLRAPRQVGYLLENAVLRVPASATIAEQPSEVRNGKRA